MSETEVSGAGTPPNDGQQAQEEKAVTVRPPALPAYVPGHTVGVSVVRRALADMREMIAQEMRKDIHFGAVAATGGKPTLLKAGAELVFKLYMARPQYVRLPDTWVDWETHIAHYSYKCQAVHVPTNTVLAEGEGSCNTQETKYALRHERPSCPECGEELFLSKDRPEWYCWRRKGGCGSVFPTKNTDGTNYFQVGKRPTTPDEWATEINTVQKMAQKRAMVAAALTLGTLSEHFTQDMEEDERALPAAENGQGPEAQPHASAQRPVARGNGAASTRKAAPARSPALGGGSGQAAAPADKGPVPEPDTMKTMGDVFNAAVRYFGLKQPAVLRELGYSKVGDMRMSPPAAWAQLLVTKGIPVVKPVAAPSGAGEQQAMGGG